MISWGSSKIQRLKFDNIFFTNESLVDKEIQFEENKFKIGCLRTWLDFVKGLIEFMEGLIVIKFEFN